MHLRRVSKHRMLARSTPASCQPYRLERMTSSYNRLAIKRFPRVQERETAEARYWRNFTNPEVQVRGSVVHFWSDFCDRWPPDPRSYQLCALSPRACATCLRALLEGHLLYIRCVLDPICSRPGCGCAGMVLACIICSTLVLASRV